MRPLISPISKREFRKHHRKIIACWWDLEFFTKIFNIFEIDRNFWNQNSWNFFQNCKILLERKNGEKGVTQALIILYCLDSDENYLQAGSLLIGNYSFTINNLTSESLMTKLSLECQEKIAMKILKFEKNWNFFTSAQQCTSGQFQLQYSGRFLTFDLEKFGKSIRINRFTIGLFRIFLETRQKWFRRFYIARRKLFKIQKFEKWLGPSSKTII